MCVQVEKQSTLEADQRDRLHTKEVKVKAKIS